MKIKTLTIAGLATPSRDGMTSTYGLIRKGRLAGWAALMILVTSTPSVLADADIYRYVSPNGTVYITNVPSDAAFTPMTGKGRYHASISDRELEEAVARYAREYRLSPALLMAVMKAESDFNPTVISKAGAVGLMQLIPETAIRHGVRNLYDTGENIAGGAKHLRYLLDRFNGNIRLALAAYNAGERKVDRYRQIPPFKETKTYVKKVMGFYRDYRSSTTVMALNDTLTLR
ncbi:lytic transglycosylase domain-containing protein [Nitrospira moscoviensis]|uniref:Lytic murein transglycosylase n=1 Tax=Nitrospira moscoviensis TaxID=42253 RepID=A0A0K2G821_NITMO|nr:lytic transglycosylase domain-containing protein [Nitrospira moscoviensis]ALA56757.1 Lytic murein transglycosylase [Nitrospira moscoviensis]